MRVYIASPYSMGDQAENVRKQILAADHLMTLGHIPFAPTLSHFQHMVRPRPYEDWMKCCLSWVEMCDIVLRLPGYSPGADREVAHAEKNGIPVVFSLETLVMYSEKIKEMYGHKNDSLE